MGKRKVVYTYSEEKGKWAVIAEGGEFHVARRRILEMDGGDGCIRM